MLYDVSDPTLPVETGAASDNGDAIVFANGHTFVGGAGPLNVYDVSDPYHPSRVNSIGGPTYDMFVRRNLLFSTMGSSPTRFSILNISDPLNITEVSRLSGYAGEGVYANDSFALVSCIRDHIGLFVVDVSDSTQPLVRDSINPEGVVEWQPYAPSPNSYGYLADDYGGLVVVDMHDVNDLSFAWEGYKADRSVDVAVDNGRAYIADHWVGAQVVDVSDPTRPFSLGVYDTSDSRGTNTATARDSFAFVGYSGPPSLRVVNVTDPRSPMLVAEESCYNWPMDCVLRDSLLYAAAEYMFQVFNVARPREPVRMGRCGLPGSPGKLVLGDSTAYAATFGVQCLSIVDPDSPSAVGAYGTEVVGLDIVDTIVYGAGPYTGIISLSVANPAAPYLLDSLNLTDTLWWNDVVVADSIAYVGGDRVLGVDVSDPRNMRLIPQVSWTPPYYVCRLLFAPPYLYAVCVDAGMCILETLPVGIEEEHSEKGGATREWNVSPSVTAGSVVITAASTTAHVALSLFNAGGFRVGERQVRLRLDETGLRCSLDLSALPDGVYFVNLHGDNRSFTAKVVKTKGR